jgi:anti-sigma factor RsiW
MTSHEFIQESLALSAAGLLDPADERQVREHILECRECAARLEALGDLASALSGLPAPLPPSDLAARTQARLAAELAEAADSRQGAILAGGSAVLGWMLALALGYVCHRFGIGSTLGWALWSTVPACMAAPVVAGLIRRSRLERLPS